MSLVEKMKNVLADKEEEFASSASYEEMSKFYKEMQDSGVAKKPEYSLPRLDTTGQRLRQVMSGRQLVRTRY